MEIFRQAIKLLIFTALLLAPGTVFSDERADNKAVEKVDNKAVEKAGQIHHPYTVLIPEVQGFGFYNDGQPVGIGTDITTSLNRVLDFKIAPAITRYQTIQSRISTGDFDLAMIYERESLLILADPVSAVVSVSYLQISQAPYPSLESLTTARVGYLQRTSLSPDLQRALPGMHFFESFNTGLEALNNDAIDVFIGTRSNMSSGEDNINSRQAAGLIKHSFLSTNIFLYARKGLLTDDQINQLQRGLKMMRESNMISKIRQYYMSDLAQP